MEIRNLYERFLIMKNNKMENNKDVWESFSEEYEKVKDQIKKPTILVCGYTGSGKTSLIQAICGKDVVSDDKITHGKPGTMDYLKYETEKIDFWDSQGLEPGGVEDEFLEKTRKFVKRRREDPSTEKHIHLVWYVIQGSGARVTDCDLTLINQIFDNVIVVISKKDITRPAQLEAMKKTLIDSGVDDSHIIPVSENDRESLLELTETSYRMLPAAYKDAFVAAQELDLDKKIKKAKTVIYSASTAAAAAGGFNIFPGSDAAIITPIQVGMLASLAYIFNVRKDLLKASLLPILARTAGIMTASSLSKFFPGLGNVISAAVAAALTAAVGELTLKHLVKVFNARIQGEPEPEFVFNKDEFKNILEMAKKNKPWSKGEKE